MKIRPNNVKLAQIRNNGPISSTDENTVKMNN